MSNEVKVKIRRCRRHGGRVVEAARVRHARTLAQHGRSHDVDAYRLDDGTEIECISPTHDCRVMPEECDPEAGHYPGYPAGA